MVQNIYVQHFRLTVSAITTIAKICPVTVALYLDFKEINIHLDDSVFIERSGQV